jgi:cob(I)alamin adenosyltransferase
VTRIYTRTGDDGTTATFGGARVPKSHPRVEAYGTVDELNASLGLARASLPEGELPALTTFILPGGTPAAAALHVARGVCRRAERRCVAADQQQDLNPHARAYLNRLADWLFVAARLANHRSGTPDEEWRPA